MSGDPFRGVQVRNKCSGVRSFYWSLNTSTQAYVFQDIPPRLLSAELVGTHIQLHHQQILANTTGTKSIMATTSIVKWVRSIFRYFTPPISQLMFFPTGAFIAVVLSCPWTGPFEGTSGDPKRLISGSCLKQTGTSRSLDNWGYGNSLLHSCIDGRTDG